VTSIGSGKGASAVGSGGGGEDEVEGDDGSAMGIREVKK
jgi:hypothetical protein